MSTTRRKFDGTVANGVTKYVELTVKDDGSLGAQIAWMDATSAATITLELTSYSAHEAPVETAGAANVWKDSGLTVTGPTGAAVGCSQLNVENVRQRRARLKIVASANCSFEILQP
jgi:hypothetical protein